MINISKNLMYEDLIEKSKKIYANHSVKEISIKDILINDDSDIEKGLEKCIHDKYSDIDIAIHGDNCPIIQLKDIGILEEDILGIKLEKKENDSVIRLVQRNGIRYDIILYDINIEQIEKEIGSINKSEMFIAILSLGKLMRNDYIISAHLAHMLCMNSLVEQMVERDIKYDTNFHRYGYKEKLNYYHTYKNMENKYCDSLDDEYNHIAKLLISGIENLKSISLDDKKTFYEIWDFYKELDRNDQKDYVDKISKVSYGLEEKER